jgi:hypothetical protein
MQQLVKGVINLSFCLGAGEDKLARGEDED